VKSERPLPRDGDAADEPPSSRRIQQRLNDERQLLARLMRLDALNRGDIDSALAQVTELATELLRVERASVWRFDKHELSIECLDLYEAGPKRHSRGAIISREQAPRYFEALTRERCIAADDACLDPRTSQFTEGYLIPLGIGAMLDAPVFARGQMIGVVCHEHVGDARRWEFWEELLAGTVADFVALVTEASERLRAEQQLGLYRSHLDELERLRTDEVQRIRSGIGRHAEGAPDADLLEREVLDESPVPFIISDLTAGKIRYANPRAGQVFDLLPSVLVGRSALDFYVDPLERASVSREIELAGKVENAVVRLKTANGWPFWGLLSARRLTFENEDCVLVGLSDITAQKVAEAAVRRSEQSIRALFAAAPVAMALIRVEDSIALFANGRCADLFGIPLDEIPGQRAPDFYVDPADRDRIRARAFQEGMVDGEIVRMRRRSGEEFWALLSARMIEFEGSAALLAGISDISTQKVLEERLRDLATTDELTGLYNRRHFIELAEIELSRSRRKTAPTSLAMLDIDHFKLVNDHFGHAVGDRALVEVARAMKETLRGSDVSARLGGEEFVVLLPETTLDGALAVTERLREGVGRAEIPTGDGRIAKITVSAGVAELAATEGLDALLKRADDALYQAKQQGRNRSVTSVPPAPTAHRASIPSSSGF
jgi:diguanylate cyclase (GGDEF)-like protein/PAS domain S-box-containing protein